MTTQPPTPTPKDGMLPVGEPYTLDDILIEVRHGRMSNTKAKALITAATNEKLASGGDEELQKEVKKLVESFARDAVDASKTARGFAYGTQIDEIMSKFNTAKQTAVAEYRKRLIGLLPKEPIFPGLEEYMVMVEKALENHKYDDMYLYGWNSGVAAMRKAIEGSDE